MFLTVSEIRFTPYHCFLRHAHGVRLYMSNTAAWPTGHTQAHHHIHPSMFLSIVTQLTTAHTHMYTRIHKRIHAHEPYHEGASPTGQPRPPPLQTEQTPSAAAGTGGSCAYVWCMYVVRPV